MKFLTLLLMVIFFSGCLKILKKREDGALLNYKESPQVLALRTENANLKSKIIDYEEKFRAKDGRTEELELILRGLKDRNKEKAGEAGAEIKSYQESIATLVLEKKDLEAKISLLEDKNTQAEKKILDAKKTAQDHLKSADKLFDEKKWADSIAEYQLFREKARNKKDAEYALVTYKIGVCFQELGMISEARTFYLSVKTKFNGTKAKKYATFRLLKLDEAKKKK